MRDTYFPFHTESERAAAGIVFGVKSLAIVASIVGAFWYWNAEGHADTNNADQTIDPNTMAISFNEEFDTLDVSSWGPGTRWIAHTPWSGDFGGARFANPGKDSPFSIKDGILKIEAKRDKNGAWQSGMLASVDPKGAGFSQQYGYFEMRARLPMSPGVWPAFWLIGKDRSKATAEIDVMEYYGDKPAAFSSVVHVWYRNGKHYSKGKRTAAFLGDEPSDFHTYGVEVKPDIIRVFYDRKLVWKTETRPEHRQPMYILLNLALVEGPSNKLTPNPSHMFVDYVRAYKLIEQATP
jgi:beta-glucanase (GH16 family)